MGKSIFIPVMNKAWWNLRKDQAECRENRMLRLLDSKNTPLLPLRVPRRGNSFAFPLPTLASLRLRLSASPSRAGPSLLPYDPGGLPPFATPTDLCPLRRTQIR
jgi:hypothetical protein